VGAALAYGRVGPTEISEDKLKDERILVFAKKVHLFLDHDIQRSFPSSTLARVELILIDGTRFTVAPVPTRGDYQNPFTEEELEDKFRRYTEKLLKDGDINETISLIKDIEQAENVSKVTERLNDAVNNNLAKIR
jgi:2-methylcitrate dehydratase PrpD